MSSLREKAIRGVKWTSLSTLIVIVVEFLRIAVLAHLLKPEDFGLFGMIIVVLTFAQTFADVGVSNAIIQKDNTTRNNLSSLYWLTIFSGIVMYLIVVALSPLIVMFYDEPRLKSLIPLAALNFLINPIGQQFSLLLQKSLKFGLLSAIEIASAIVGTVVAIILAYQGNGVLSIIWGTLAGSFWGCIWLLIIGIRKWQPAFRFKLKDLRGYISFGLYQVGERSVNYLSANVDYLFIGRFLGPDILGVYMIAYQLVVKPLFRINPVLLRVAFPIFSKKQKDNDALRRGYLELLKLLAFIIFPLLIGLGVTAKFLIPVVYGKGWEMAIPLVQILVFVGIIKTLSNPWGYIVLAKGRADITFKWAFAVAVINIVVFWFIAQKGVFYVAWTWVALAGTYFLFGWYILKELIKLQFKNYFLMLFKPALMAISMGLIVLATIFILRKIIVDNVSMLIALIATGILVYGMCVIIFQRKYLFEMIRLLIGNKKEKA